MKPNPVGRRLRISSTRKPGSTHGHHVDVSDADTGENISGVYKIVLTLVVNQVNEAEVSYYDIDDNGGLMVDKNRKVIENTTTVQNVEIDDITAFEIMDNIRKELR